MPQLTHAEDVDARAGCSRPRPFLRYQLIDGRLLPVRCGSPNLCDFCRFMATLEWATMVLRDAVQGPPPTLGLTLTTARPSTDAALVRYAVKEVRALLRRELGRVEDLAKVEFTSGLGKRSGGHRRLHLHLLVKLLDAGVTAEQALALEAAVRGVWERLTGAHRIELAELRTPAGAAHYLTHHHGKTAQLPPKGWTGRRFRATQGFFTAPRAERVAAARAQLLDERLNRRVVATVRAELDAQDVDVDDDQWNQLVAGDLDHARSAAAEGVELVRVQRVPVDFGDDGLPASWRVEVLGPAMELA